MTNWNRLSRDYQEVRRLLLQAQDKIDEVLAIIDSLERNSNNDFVLFLEVEQIKVKITEAANQLLPEEPNEEDRTNIYPTCESCSYYAESQHIVCALHPLGPTEDDCPDYEDAVGEAVQFPLDRPYENPWHPDPEENWSPPGTRYVEGQLVFVG